MTHPRGLYSLFFTEMWERFSYYGMKALLVLFMCDQLTGMKMAEPVANAIAGLYGALVYLSALPGGWVGQRFMGVKRAVWWGGVVIALGHVILGMDRGAMFYLGLVVVALGSGLLKSNMSVLVGQLYPNGGAEREAGFRLFYLGINVGGFLGPLVCAYLAAEYGWEWGFGAAAVGMGLGLLQFWLTRHHLHGAGEREGGASKADHWQLWLGLGVTIALIAMVGSGVWKIDPVPFANQAQWAILVVAIGFFAKAFFLDGLGSVDKRNMVVIAVLVFCSALFWAGFEQSSSSFSIIAERLTLRHLSDYGWPAAWGNWEVPAGWLQSVNAILVVCLIPVVGWVWLALAQRKLEPSLPGKLGWSMILLAAAFAVISPAMARAVATGPIGVSPLLLSILLMTLGELCISPVGLSAVSSLAPSKLAGQCMGVWFLGSALGNILAGTLAGEVTGENTAAMPGHFMNVAVFCVACGVVLLALAPWLRRLMTLR
jgi:proton-dependent oligopeptide transporter, POT family